MKYLWHKRKPCEECPYKLGQIRVRRRIEIGVNCILNSRLLPTRLCSHTDNCTVQEGKLQLFVALF